MDYRNTKAIVVDIQRYSLHDGPGIRSLVFLKGCPLRCLWCCNPESQLCTEEVEFYQDLCRQCGLCINACLKNAINSDLKLVTGYKINKSICDNCGYCIKVCEPKALRFVGRWYTVNEVVKEITKDSSYYRTSGGGITLSGGEPLLWVDFCKDLLKTCYELNIHTAIETCGYVPWENLKRTKEFTDLYLYDIKHIDPIIHQKLTGKTNKLIIENLRLLRRAGKQVIIRVPLIPNYNFDKENLNGIAALAKDLNIEEINIMPYHELGKVKYKRLSRDYCINDAKDLKFASNSEEELKKAVTIFEDWGLNALIGG